MSLARLLNPRTRGDVVWLGAPWPWEHDRIAPFIQECKDIGVGGVRCGTDWTAINPRAGVYNVDQFDPMFRALHDAGLTIQTQIGYTPGYMQSPDNSGNYGHTPPDPSRLPQALFEYEASCYALSKRYPYVHIVELWSNEANAPFGAHPVRPDIAYLLGAVGARGWRRAKREQGQPSIVLMNSVCAVGYDPNHPENGIRPDVWVDRMYEMHDFFSALNHQDSASTPVPWDALNTHPYMNWGDAFAASTQGFGNSLAFLTNVLVYTQAKRSGDRQDIHRPYLWGSEAGWPTTFGHGVDKDVNYMARRGGWNGSGFPTEAQIENGAGVVARDHLEWWFRMQDKNFVGPYSIFHYDAHPNGTGWPYGLYTDVLGGRAKRHVAVLKELCARPWTPPAGWMADVRVPA